MTSMGVVAACLVFILIAAVVSALPKMSDISNLPVGNEYAYEKGYSYSVDTGVFTTYVCGKVIAENKIGNKIENVAITAGWKNGKGEWLSNEHLRAEVYSIKGVPNDVAVALKFLDKGEAVLTTYYYVIMNPYADLTLVEEYIIRPIVPNNSGEEFAEEVPE